MLVPGGTKAGIITKPYGLRGEVYSILEPHSAQSLQADIPLFIDMDGQRVPFFVEDLELISDDQAIIKFEFIDSPEAARDISGCPFYFDTHAQPPASESGEDLSELVGYTAFDKASGRVGRISDYLMHPMNPVFIIEAEGQELMVPAVKDFIEEIDHKDRRVHLILPEGLTSL